MGRQKRTSHSYLADIAPNTGPATVVRHIYTEASWNLSPSSCPYRSVVIRCGSFLSMPHIGNEVSIIPPAYGGKLSEEYGDSFANIIPRRRCCYIFRLKRFNQPQFGAGPACTVADPQASSCRFWSSALITN